MSSRSPATKASVALRTAKARVRTPPRGVTTPLGRSATSRPRLTPLEQSALLFICQLAPSSTALAKALHVAVPTVSRIIARLRKAGTDVVSVRGVAGWHYEVREASDVEVARDPLLLAEGAIHSWRRDERDEDEIIYG